MRLLVILSFVGLITGCVTGQKSSDLDYSIKNIQSAIAQTLPGGINLVSVNRREFRSNYFRPDIYYRPLSRDRDLYRSKLNITILGASRPYRLVVRAFTQVRVSDGKPKSKVHSADDLKKGTWKDVEVSGIEDVILELIVDHILKSSKDNNLVDDFHPF